LAAGELAINTVDGKLFYKDSSNVVQVLATKGGTGASTDTQVLYNSSGLTVGSANLTFNGTVLTGYGGLFSNSLKAPTMTAGTSTTDVATTAFVVATSFSSALPGQTGNAGKYVTTDGVNASWGTITFPPAGAQGFVTQFTGGNTPPTMQSSGFGLI
jgi:hypothetical protein